MIHVYNTVDCLLFSLKKSCFPYKVFNVYQTSFNFYVICQDGEWGEKNLNFSLSSLNHVSLMLDHHHTTIFYSKKSPS